MSGSQPNSHSSPTEALQTLGAAENRTAWGPEDWAWDSQTLKAVSKSASPKDHPPCSAPANLAQAIPQISGEMKPKTNISAEPTLAAPPETSGGSGATAAAATAPSAKQTSSAHFGRPGYCQADGCGKNLSKLTFYHVRNKICDVHIKADQFSRDGVFLRFCQRCGYPHTLDEFDGTKHSCRAQLEKHNARRRKRQAEAAAQKGGKQQAASRGAVKKDKEKGDLEEELVVAPKLKEQQKRQPPPRRSNRRQKTRFTAAEIEKMEGDEEEEEEEQQRAQQTHRPASVKHTAAAAAAAFKGTEPKQKQAESSGLPFFDLNTSNLALPAGEPQQKSASVGPTTDSTSAAPDAADEEPPLMIDDLTTWLNTQFADLQDLDPSNPAPADGNTDTQLLPLPQGMTSFDFAAGLLNSHHDEILSTSTLTDAAPSIFDSMPIDGSSENPLPPPVGPKLTRDAILSTVSVKLFGCTPAELPLNLREQLATWFNGQVRSLEGYLRPGCVHLTVQATVEPEKEGEERTNAKRRHPEGGKNGSERVLLQGSLLTTGGVSCLVEKMLSSGESLWRTKTLIVQAGTEVALVHGGKLKQIWEIGSTPGERAVPAVLEMKPIVLLANSANNEASTAKKTCCGGAAKHQHQPHEIILQGVNLLQDNCEIVCRLQGEYVPVESAGCAECSCSASVKSCCQSSGSGDDSAAASAAGEWENKCCGCCIAKLASLSIQEDPEDKSKSKKKKSSASSSSCCASERTTEATVDTVTPQLVSLKLESPSLLRPGVLHIDVLKNAFMAPQGGRVLVVDSPTVHAELLNLAARAPAAGTGWVDALGVVFEWIGDRKKMEYSVVERTAAKLLHEAIRHGLVEVAKYLHGLLQAELMAVASSLALPPGMDGLDALAFMSQADQACKTVTLLRAIKLAVEGGYGNMTLLHLAVQSQNPDAVELVLGWGRECERPWRCDVRGPYGLTPLHFAVLVTDPVASAQMVLNLVASCEPGMQAWKEALTSDGLTPADFADRLGRVGLLATFGRSTTKQERQDQNKEQQQEGVLADLAKGMLKTVPVMGAETETEAPSTPRRCKCTGPCPCALSAEPCASCGSSDDEGCCGSENGQCCCCSSGKTKEEEDAKKEGGCCAARTLARACCH